MARRHESLIPLSHEHHDALLLAWRLRTGDLSKREPELRAKHVSAFFEYRLVNHLKLEEELVFPAFRAVLGVEASLIDVYAASAASAARWARRGIGRFQVVPGARGAAGRHTGQKINYSAFMPGSSDIDAAQSPRHRHAA